MAEYPSNLGSTWYKDYICHFNYPYGCNAVKYAKNLKKVRIIKITNER